jgi:uncharacterized protein (DUF2062 family)
VSSNNRISRFLNFLFEELFKINDTPQKIALGLGLGVFAGILPGTGPVAAIFLAFVFRVNRASALFGSLVTNTWLSIVTFLLSIKIGAMLLGMKWENVRQDWNLLLKGFSWLSLFKLSILKIALPVVIGYLLIAFCAGSLAYVVSLIISKNIIRLQQNTSIKNNK